MHIHDIGFQVKEVRSSGTFAGYGAVYDVIDKGDDIVCRGAFSESLDSWSSRGRMPALLWQHRQSEPCGVYTKMTEDENGLYVEGKLALKTQRGAEAYELMQMKAISGLSIGFMPRVDFFDQKTGVRTIQKGDLWECSLVTFPMNDLARVSTVKAVEEITDFKSAERYLREAGGLSRSEAVAIVSRIKSLAQRDSGADEEAQQLIKALSRRSDLLKT